jgi:hypothetical protein
MSVGPFPVAGPHSPFYGKFSTHGVLDSILTVMHFRYFGQILKSVVCRSAPRAGERPELRTQPNFKEGDNSSFIFIFSQLKF